MARSKQNGLYRRQGIFCFRYKDDAGQWREKSTGETDRTEAKARKQEFMVDLAQGRIPTDKAAQSVEQACSMWVDQHAPKLGSDKARRNEKSLLRQLTKHLGSRKLRGLTLDDLKNYQAERLKTVSARPINLELRILVSVLKESNLWHRIGQHFKPLPETKSDLNKALSDEQLRHLESTAAARDAWQVAYYAQMLAANTGLRGGEIKRLRLGVVDLEARRIQIVRKATKSDAGARLVELNQAATAAVCRLCVRAQQLGASQPDHYLLPADLSRHTKAHDPLHGQRGFDPTRHAASWDTAWRNLRAAAARAIVDKARKENRQLAPAERETVRLFEGLRFHSLRHTFITDLGERGVPLQTVQAMVGHMSPEMTRYYTHISSQAARAAVELLDRRSSGRRFVEGFVENQESSPTQAANLLN